MVTDRRNDLRAPVSILAALESSGGEAPVMLLDLSSTGACIQTDDPPDETAEYQIHFSVHQVEFSARFRVIHWTTSDGIYHWGCSFESMSEEALQKLTQAVAAAAGLSSTTQRPWTDILEEAYLRREDQIVVGHTPSGREVRLLAHECLDICEEGVELFVKTGGSLESS